MRKFLFLGLMVSLGFTLADTFKVAPEKYRKWNHVKSMVIFDQKHPLFNPFSGIHHVYVNDKGLEAIVEGAKRIEAFTVKDSKKYKETDGWGYFAYDGKGNNIVKDMFKDCHACHSHVKDKDFVFSTWTK